MDVTVHQLFTIRTASLCAVGDSLLLQTKAIVMGLQSGKIAEGGECENDFANAVQIATRL